jgi:hypothetical protein
MLAILADPTTNSLATTEEPEFFLSALVSLDIIRRMAELSLP